MVSPVPNPDPDAERLFERVAAASERLGLHFQGGTVIGCGDPSPAMSEAIEEGKNLSLREALSLNDGRLALTCMFTVGKLAWSDRVQNPERLSEELEFSDIVSGSIDPLDMIRQTQAEAEAFLSHGDEEEFYDDDGDDD